MLVDQVLIVDFGSSKLNATGSSGVGFKLLDMTGSVYQNRTTDGVYQTAPGIYAAKVSLTSSFLGQIVWDTGDTFVKKYYASEVVDPTDLQVISQLAGDISSTAATLASEHESLENLVNQISSSAGSIDLVVGSVQDDLYMLKEMTLGRWHIINNQMIFYASDNVTEISRYNLFDDTGAPSMEAVFDRVKV